MANLLLRGQVETKLDRFNYFMKCKLLRFFAPFHPNSITLSSCSHKIFGSYNFQLATQFGHNGCQSIGTSQNKSTPYKIQVLCMVPLNAHWVHQNVYQIFSPNFCPTPENTQYPLKLYSNQICTSF